MENIGKNLKFNRENAKKSVYDIETDLGISHQNQYNWEKGAREPSIIHCVKLADYFGISIDELIGRDYSASAPVKNAPGLSKREEELLKAFDCLDVYQQDFFFNQITATARENTLIKK